ncbi:MAG: hypothetical protein KF746_03145 [Chitinophagaceae bacterium]|nr:hypothetical protein [Chitinophagaceae bacterium]
MIASKICKGRKIYIVLILIFCATKGVSQNKVILNENFEKIAFRDTTKNNLTSERYAITTYRPKEKTGFGIFSNRKDYPFSIFYTENSCPTDSTNLDKGFYAGIKVYDKIMPSNRELMVIKLDTLLNPGKRYSISYSAKYHQFTKYRIDSMQALFVTSEDDIKLWLASREFSGMYVELSLNNIDNKAWKSVKADFTATGVYSYMVISNLQSDGQTKVYKADDCKCGKRPKGFWGYSEIFLDDIMIIEK